MKKEKKRSATAPTNRSVQEILPKLLGEIDLKIKQRPDQVLSCWSEIVGEQIAKMTCAKSFENGFLKVEVHNSTLYSLLSQHERPRLLSRLRKRFPSLNIQNILFRIG
ncbi:MAG: DUF721 domain-containing protein [Simkania negevensis]|nr:DUF721 domain-containing protein [Simkania negevensis]